MINDGFIPKNTVKISKIFDFWSANHSALSLPSTVEAFSKAEAADLLRRSTSRALQAPEGWHLDRGEEVPRFCCGRRWETHGKNHGNPWVIYG